MAHWKWKETKLQPGTAGPGNMLGCSLVSLHFLWAIPCPQAVHIALCETATLSRSGQLFPRHLLLYESGGGGGEGREERPQRPFRRAETSRDKPWTTVARCVQSSLSNAMHKKMWQRVFLVLCTQCHVFDMTLDAPKIRCCRYHNNTEQLHRMWHRKWRETKHQSSMLPGPDGPGCCLVSFHISCVTSYVATLYCIKTPRTHSLILQENNEIGGLTGFYTGNWSIKR